MGTAGRWLAHEAGPLGAWLGSRRQGYERAAGQDEALWNSLSFLPPPPSNQCSIRRKEIDTFGGTIGRPDARSSRVNHCASSNSSSRRWINVVRACAVNPSISDEGKGQGCEE